MTTSTKKKIVITLTTLVLVILPFLLSIAISNYSPYVETNSFQRYILICTVISIAIVSIVLLIFNYFPQSFDNISVGGALLFLLVCPLFGIFGLASAPDLSLKMLEHPEREHLRYSLLFLALLLFLGFILFLFSSHSLKIKKTTSWIMTVILIVTFAEYIWEFTHHYLYPEGLKEWVSQGKNAEEFGKNYENFNIITIGVIGRYFQFISVMWLSLHLYKLQQIKIWCPIINTLFSLLGIISATLIFITKMNLPKGFEILFLFFIPGIPFFLLYWLGVALLTKFKKSEMAT
jgi:hypothetical protein